MQLFCFSKEIIVYKKLKFVSFFPFICIWYIFTSLIFCIFIYIHTHIYTIIYCVYICQCILCHPFLLYIHIFIYQCVDYIWSNYVIVVLTDTLILILTVMLNFVYQLDYVNGYPASWQTLFLVCLWQCFWKKLAFES